MMMNELDWNDLNDDIPEPEINPEEELDMWIKTLDNCSNPTCNGNLSFLKLCCNNIIYYSNLLA